MVIGTAVGLSNAAKIVLAVVLAFVFGYALTMRGVLRRVSGSGPLHDVDHLCGYRSGTRRPDPGPPKPTIDTLHG